MFLALKNTKISYVYREDVYGQVELSDREEEITSGQRVRVRLALATRDPAPKQQQK